MTKTFTQNDLIRYIYGETSDREEKLIREALLCDDSLQELYKKLRGIIQKLDEVNEEPSEKVIDNILKYSKTVNLHSVNK